MRTHGNASTYTTGGCRCDLCREAQRLSSERRRRRLGVPVMQTGPQGPHGGIKRYRKWGCRCDECRAAESARRRRWRQQAREAS